MNQPRLSAPALPAGWFQIGWSHELAAGEVRPIRAFGHDLVLCRYESGGVGLFDAFCPHMGAHIGYGGKTVGEDLACPYHGWRFDKAGCNTLVPYSERTSRSAKLRSWHVQEISNSLIVAWYSPHGTEPTFDAPDAEQMPGAGEDGFCPVSDDTTRRYPATPMQVDFVTENTVDMSHFKFVHETPEIGSLIDLDPVDHRFHVKFSMPMKLYSDEGGEIVDTVTELTNWGLGFIFARFADGATVVQAQTPVDEGVCDVMMTVILPREDDSSDRPTGKQMARFKMACRQVENDMLIWQHRRHGAQAHLVAEEIAGFKTFAKWKRQFYADTTASNDGKTTYMQTELNDRASSEARS